MATKRKDRTYARSSSPDQHHNERRKRLKVNIPSSSTEDSELSDGEYLIKCILDESESEYLIDWEGPWTPTWEPKENANDVAVRVWEQKKRNIAEDRHRAVEGSKAEPSTLSHTSGRGRRREYNLPKAIPSFTSDDVDTARSSAVGAALDATAPASSATREGERHSTSGRSSSPLFVTPDPQLPEGNDESQHEIPETQPVDVGPSECVSSLLPVISGEISYDSHLFEHIPKSSIPSEYRLLDEIEAPTERETYSQSSLYPDHLKLNRTQSLDSTNDIQDFKPFNHQQLEIKEESEESSDVSDAELATWVSAKSQPSALELGARDDSPRLPLSLAPTEKSCTADWSKLGGLHPPADTAAVTIYRNQSDLGLALTHTPQNAKEPAEEKAEEQALIYPSNQTPKELENTNITEQSSTLTQSEVMEKYSHIPGATLREKMEYTRGEMRAKISETRNMLRASTRSSKSPARVPSAEITQPHGDELGDKHIPSPVLQEGVLTSEALSRQPEERYLEADRDFVQTVQPSALSISHKEPAPGSVRLGPSEFAIPLPMDSRVKDIYESVLKQKARSIEDFMNSFAPSSKLSETERLRLTYKMNEVVEQLGNVTTHPDINMIEDIRYSQSDLELEASWGEYSSSKFLFLSFFLRLADDRDLHIVVMVQTPKRLEILERFLLGKGLVHTRPRHEIGPGTDSELSMAKGSLSFGIQTTRNDGIVQTYRPPSMILALDQSFSAQTPSVEHIRATYARNENLLPVIRLLISNSCEHIQCCLPDVPPLQRLRLLIHHTTHLLDAVGDLQDDALNVEEDVEEVLACLASDNFNTHWSLPVIEPLQIVQLDELDSAVGYSHSYKIPGDTLTDDVVTQKRSAQVEEPVIPVSKRQRVEDVQAATQLGQSQDLFMALNTDPRLPDAELGLVKSVNIAELDQIKEVLSITELRLRESIKTLDELQYRYESKTKEMNRVRQELDSLAASKLALEESTKRQKEEIISLKDERAGLKRDLAHAREAIKAGGGGAAELEAANGEIRRLTKENSSLERKADYEKSQCEYTREQYQNASAAAAQSMNEIRSLKSENETLKRRAEGEATRLYELNLNSSQERHLSRVKELELTLASRDDLLQKKEDELREIRKNRPSTRSTSTQPRSPKLVSANSRPPSPSLNNNHNGTSSLGRQSALRFSSEAA